MNLSKTLSSLTRFEKMLWSLSVLCITAFFLLFDRNEYLTLVASLVGVSSLIFCAKGNPFGQMLMILFSLLYGVISYTFSYYGEMLTYLGMTMPMAIFSLIEWLRHPFKGNHAEVEVGKMSKRQTVFMCLLTALVTGIFYFVLEYFGTANLIPSTVSVATSFLAVYLTLCRSPYYALAYAANDVVLIVLWSLAALSETRYLAVVVCFAAFLVNDMYGFFNWRRMGKRQHGDM